MGKISNQTKYPLDSVLTGEEYVIGTDVGGNTVTFSIDQIAAFVESGFTALEVKTLYESNSDTNAFTDSEKSKLAGLEDNRFLGTYLSLAALQVANPSPSAGTYGYVDPGVGTDVNMYIWDDDDNDFVLSTGAGIPDDAATIKTKYESNLDTNAFTDALLSKLNGVETGATGDQTGSEIKALYEAEADTNAFTDAEKASLAKIDTTNTVAGNAFIVNVSNIAELRPLLLSDVSDYSNPSLSATDQVISGSTARVLDVGNNSSLTITFNDSTNVFRVDSTEVQLSRISNISGTNTDRITISSPVRFAEIARATVDGGLPSSGTLNYDGGILYLYNGSTWLDLTQGSSTNISNSDLNITDAERNLNLSGVSTVFNITNGSGTDVMRVTKDQFRANTISNIDNDSVDPIFFSSPYNVYNQGVATSTTVTTPTEGTIIWDGPTEELRLYHDASWLILNQGGSGSLINLSDVSSATPTDKNVLVADGSNFGARALAADDIQSGTFASARISEGSVTQHQAALSITKSQISDDNYVESDITGLTGATQINNLVAITQAGYDAIGSPDANTIYEITDAVDLSQPQSGTGTALNLEYHGGFYYNMSSANTATSYTISASNLGGWAKVRINAASQPTVTGATLITGSAFAASTDMYMIVENNGNVSEYYFLEI